MSPSGASPESAAAARLRRSRSGSDQSVEPPPFPLPAAMAMVRTRTTALSKLEGKSPAGDGLSAKAQSPLATAVDLDVATVRQVDRDLPRTYPGDPLVAARLATVRAVLLRFAAEDRELGYCQGMNFLAGAVAVACHGEEEAFQRFRGLVGEVRGLWLPGFPLLARGMQHFEALAKDRPWFRHLCEHSIDASMYLPQAWLAMFATWLPLATILNFLEFFEAQGFAGVLAMTLAILDEIGGWLLTKVRQEDLQPVFGPSGLDVMVRQIPAADVLARAADAWLQAAAAEIDRPARARVGGRHKRRVTLVRHGPTVALEDDGSPGAEEEGFLGRFLAARHAVDSAAATADMAFKSALDGTEMAKQRAASGAAAAVDFAQGFFRRGDVPSQGAATGSSAPRARTTSAEAAAAEQHSWFGAPVSMASSLWAALPSGCAPSSPMETGCTRVFLFPNNDRLPLQRALLDAKRSIPEKPTGFVGLQGLISASSFGQPSQGVAKTAALTTALLRAVASVNFDDAGREPSDHAMLERLDAYALSKGRPPVRELQKSLKAMLAGPPPSSVLEEGVERLSFDVSEHGDRYCLVLAWPKGSLLNAFQPVIDGGLRCLGGTLREPER